MTLDNTSKDDALFKTNAIEGVHEGMNVEDMAGHRLGTVEYVQMGDPDAATSEGATQSSRSSQMPKSVISGATEPFLNDEPEIPDPLRSQLMRHGFIKVHSTVLTGENRYIRSDHISGVVEDTVILNVSSDELTTTL